MLISFGYDNSRLYRGGFRLPLHTLVDCAQPKSTTGPNLLNTLFTATRSASRRRILVRSCYTATAAPSHLCLRPLASNSTHRWDNFVNKNDIMGASGSFHEIDEVTRVPPEISSIRWPAHLSARAKRCAGRVALGSEATRTVVPIPVCSILVPPPVPSYRRLPFRSTVQDPVPCTMHICAVTHFLFTDNRKTEINMQAAAHASVKTSRPAFRAKNSSASSSPGP